MQRARWPLPLLPEIIDVSLSEDEPLIELSTSPSFATRTDHTGGVSAWRERLCFLLTWLAVLGVLVHNITVGEFVFNGDEGTHANSGLFVARFLHDFPISHPVKYAYRYYAHSPSFGLIHWPPLTYLVEGSLLYFWPSMLGAKVAILSFAALALVCIYKLARYFLPFPQALLVIPFLGFMPNFVLFSRAVMLEVPCISCTTAAVYFWVRFLDNPSRRNALMFALTATASFLAKQNAVYLVLFCLMVLFVFRKATIIRSANLWVAVAIIAAVAGPTYAAMAHLNGHTIAGDVFERQSGNVSVFVMYLRAIPHQMGYLMMFLALGGAIVAAWSNRRLFWLALCWVFSVYITMTLIGHKEERYVIYWLPAFALLALPLFRPASRELVRWGQVAIAVTIVAVMAHAAWVYQRPYISGYVEIAHDLLERTREGFVLVDDDNYSNLIFQLESEDPHERIYILRKALFVANWKPEMGFKELVNSYEDVSRIVDGYGVRYLLISDGAPLQYRSQQILREYLNLRGNTAPAGTAVLLYENQQVHQIENQFLRIPMMTIDHDIVVPVEAPDGR
jgi:hypothetical protein